MSIAVYTITSGLHDEASVSKLSDEFLKNVFPEGDFVFRGADFSDFGTHTLDLIYVRTGGAEGIFKALLPEMLARGTERYYLLTSGKSNSLAASLEILSYLRQQGLKGEVLHGSDAYVARRIQVLATVQEARARLKDMRIGVVGQPSDWRWTSSASGWRKCPWKSSWWRSARPTARPPRPTSRWPRRSGKPIPAPSRSTGP